MNKLLVGLGCLVLYGLNGFWGVAHAGGKGDKESYETIFGALKTSRAFRHDGLNYKWENGRVVLANGDGVKGIDKIVETHTAPRWEHRLKLSGGGCGVGAASAKTLALLGEVMRDKLSRESVEIGFPKNTGLSRECEKTLLDEVRKIVSAEGVAAKRLKIDSRKRKKWGKGMKLRFLILPR